jgi:Uncharacterized protein conserved in bacteria
MNFRSFYLSVLLGLAAILTGCSSDGVPRIFTNEYGAVTDAGYKLPSVPVDKIPSKYHRQVVSYKTDEKPGTIIVDTKEKFLYLVMEGGKAMRYGIGVGRQGFEWSGTARVAMKREWPTWTPPAEMIKRQPELAKCAAACPLALATRWAPVRSTCSTRTVTRVTACTARRNGIRSARPCPPAVSACSTRTSSTFTTASRLAPR